MKNEKIIYLILLIFFSPIVSSESNFSFSDLSGNRFGVELCGRSGNCTYYNSSAIISVNDTLDWIFKIVPPQKSINQTNNFRNNFTGNIFFSIFFIICYFIIFLMLIFGLYKVIRLILNDVI